MIPGEVLACLAFILLFGGFVVAMMVIYSMMEKD